MHGAIEEVPANVREVASRVQTLFFIHVPKTAGTYLTRVALRRVLAVLPAPRRRRLARLARVLRFGPAAPPRGTVYTCAHAVCAAKTLGIAPYHRAWTQTCAGYPELRSSLVFAVVRNPFDLLLSMYRYGFPYRRPRPDKPKAALDAIGFPFTSFADFVRAYCDRDYPWMIAPHHRFLFFQLFDDEGRCVPHVLLRTERLDEGLGRILRLFGVEPVVSSDRVNPSAPPGEPDYRSFYTDELRRLVEEKCRRELQAFGYSFVGPDERVMIDPRHVRYNPHTDQMTLETDA